MSKISNIILRKNQKDKHIPNLKKQDYHNSNQYEDKQTQFNPSISSSQTKKQTLILSSYSESIQTTKPLLLEQDSLFSQTFQPIKRFDYGQIPIQSCDVPQANTSSFCYQNEPRGGVVSLHSSPKKSILNKSSSPFKGRSKNRSKTEMKDRSKPSNYNAIKTKIIHDDMKEVWLKEISISTADSFNYESISNELVLPKKDWIYLEVIDNEISFHYKTIHAIQEHLAKQKKEKVINFCLLSLIKGKNEEMNLNHIITSFENEIFIEGINKPNMSKTKTILKSAPPQLKSQKKQIENEQNDDHEYKYSFDIKIINKTHKERWNDLNAINSSEPLSFNLISNSNNDDIDNSINNDDQYYFIHQRKNQIINKILLNSSQIPINFSINNLINTKQNHLNLDLQSEQSNALSLLSSLRKTNDFVRLTQTELNYQILFPHISQCISFTVYSILPTKKWDPVIMRKENQERIDYVIEKSILLRTSGNRHIKESYKMEYDEIVEEELISNKIQNKCIFKLEFFDLMFNGIPLNTKWNKYIDFIHNDDFCLKNGKTKWIIKRLYPMQTHSVSFKSNNKNKQCDVSKQINGQAIDNVRDENADFTFDFSQNKELTHKIQNHSENETDLISMIINRWNSNSISYESINFNLIQSPISILLELENDNKLEILQKGKPMKNNNMIPYQAINFHLDPLLIYYDYANDNQMEFICKNKDEKQNVINELQIGEPIEIELLTNKRKIKIKKQIQSNNQNKKENDELKNENDNEKKQYENEEERNDLNKNIAEAISNEGIHKTGEDKYEIKADNICIEEEEEKVVENTDKMNQVLKSKNKKVSEKPNKLPQYEKNKSLPVNSKKKNELFPVLIQQKNYGETAITKPKEKEKLKKPQLIKQSIQDFEIFTKDQGIQRIKTNNIK